MENRDGTVLNDVEHENDGGRDGVCSIREIQAIRSSVVRDESQRLSDRLSAAAAIERSLADEASAQGASANACARPFELPARVVARGFSDINREIVPNVSYVFAGGRGSGKSSFISLKIIELLMRDPMRHACVVRKVAATLRDSVYAQLEWAVRELGLAAEFRFTQSPLEIVRTATGQTIYFRGCDDAAKLKSTKPPFGYIGILWREEADQLSGAEEGRHIAQSILRGGDESYDFSSYNPPRSRQNWINRLAEVRADGRVLHRSTYLDVPAAWLGRRFLDDAERLKKTDPRAYEHEYLGVPNGDGGSVFERLEVRRITDEEISGFDRIFQGIDFGWYPDPFAFLRTHYDAARERIFLLDELYATKLPNADAAAWILGHGYADARIVCDSAEPKSVAELRGFGVPAFAAVKGPGSVSFGFKWLSARTLVIDPERTPNAYREILGYEFERGRDGEVRCGFPDGNDHAISALRYAYEAQAGRRGACGSGAGEELSMFTLSEKS